MDATLHAPSNVRCEGGADLVRAPPDSHGCFAPPFRSAAGRGRKSEVIRALVPTA